MKLSVSNIGWSKEDSPLVLSFMKENEYNGLEIAPTMIIPENPYDKINEIKDYAKMIKETYGLDIPSMQSIWYGQQGNIFNKDEQKVLLEYTKKAILFAEAINCKNLVFGCPRNRNMEEGHTIDEVIPFFKELGDFAYLHNTVLAMEANPPIYNTNFINKTIDAIDLVKKVNSKGFLVNLDFGTIIENSEDLSIIEDNIEYINHIHISEPNLVKIENREEHKKLKEIVDKNNYDKYISIEMKNTGNIEDIKETISYVKKIFK